ncbi:alkene reductase, partial [Mycobacterium sp. ITM-2017-0098]
PGNRAGDMREVDEISAYESLLCRITPLDIAYLHVVIEPSRPAFAAVRTVWEGTLVLNTPRDTDTDFELLENLAEWGVIGAAAVGRAFLANPDLVHRLTSGAELNVPDASTFYAPGPAGYLDYPTLDELAIREPQSA